jgi:hypothetical protein
MSTLFLLSIRITCVCGRPVRKAKLCRRCRRESRGKR